MYISEPDVLRRLGNVHGHNPGYARRFHDAPANRTIVRAGVMRDSHAQDRSKSDPGYETGVRANPHIPARRTARHPISPSHGLPPVTNSIPTVQRAAARQARRLRSTFVRGSRPYCTCFPNVPAALREWLVILYLHICMTCHGSRAHAPARNRSSVIAHSSIPDASSAGIFTIEEGTEKRTDQPPATILHPVPNHPAHPIETDELCILTKAVYKALPFP